MSIQFSSFSVDTSLPKGSVERNLIVAVQGLPEDRKFEDLSNRIAEDIPYSILFHPEVLKNAMHGSSFYH